MAQLSQTDASSIANAARCFNNCTGGSAESSLKTYLLTQTADIATPPCITPTAPITSATAKVIGPNSLFITWNQISNSGSLITGYTVKWGTASGVYTNSATVPVIPRSYTITGLNTGTQYFWVIVANSSAAVGCSSANSSEGTATTSGAAPSNKLLQSLISYWKFDVNVSPYADSIGGNPVTGASTTAGVVAGIINGGLDVSSGNAQASHTANTDFNPNANTSFAFSLWVTMTDWTSDPAIVTIAINGDGGANPSWQFYKEAVGNGNRPFLFLWDSGSTVFGGALSAAAPTGGVFHHLVLSFDSPTKTMKGWFDSVLKFTTVTNTNSILSSAVGFRFGPGAGNPSAAGYTIDESAMWHKSLTQTDVNNIYNGGVGLPLSGYQA